jgi:hypothetical protein
VRNFELPWVAASPHLEAERGLPRSLEMEWWV